jgi:hypothetical protein
MDARTFQSGALSCVCVCAAHTHTLCTYSFHYRERVCTRPQSINFNIKMEYSRRNFYLSASKTYTSAFLSLRAPNQTQPVRNVCSHNTFAAAIKRALNE